MNRVSVLIAAALLTAGTALAADVTGGTDAGGQTGATTQPARSTSATQPSVSLATPSTSAQRRDREAGDLLAKATDIIDARVRTRDGQDIGEVKDLGLDTDNGRVAIAVVERESATSGQKLVAVPWSAIRQTGAGENLHFTVDFDAARLASAPSFDSDNWPDLSDPRWLHSAYRAFNQRPYWERVTDRRSRSEWSEEDRTERRMWEPQRDRNPQPWLREDPRFDERRQTYGDRWDDERDWRERQRSYARPDEWQNERPWRDNRGSRMWDDDDRRYDDYQERPRWSERWDEVRPGSGPQNWRDRDDRYDDRYDHGGDREWSREPGRDRFWREGQNPRRDEWQDREGPVSRDRYGSGPRNRMERQRSIPSYNTPVIRKASDVIGIEVTNPTGRDLGDIEDLMIETREGRIAYAVLSFGGFLGIGDKLFAIPWQAFQSREAGESFVLNVPKARLERAPGFDKDNWPDMASADWGRDIYEYYGFEPDLVIYSYTIYGEPISATQPSSAEDSGDRAYQRRFDPAAIETLSGEIGSITRAAPTPGASRVVILSVRTDDGRTRTVHLGPPAFVRSRLPGLETGKRVTVRGSRVTIDGREVVMATEVTEGSRTVQFRQGDGSPLWGSQMDRAGRGRE